MRIVIDLQSCQSGSRHGGIGRYSLALAKAMIKSEPSWDYIVLLNENFPREANDIRAELSGILPPSNILTFHAPNNTAAMQGNEDRTRAAEVLRETFIEALNPDIVHLTSLFEGLHDDVVTSVGLVRGAAPTAVTLYDLIPFHARDLYLTSYRPRAQYFEKVRQLQQAALLLAISQFSADEASEALPRYAGDIVNIQGGVEPRFRPLKFTTSWDDPRPRHGIDRRFILYTASFDPRKNQANLIRAFSRLPDRLRERYQLVFIGHSSPDTFNHLLSLGYDAGLREGDVRFLGRVSDEDLVQLYNLCEAFVFPPKWEGLGLPVLEAMACGAPAIGSDSTAVSEVVGRHDALFDPNDVDSIAKKISHVLEDSAFRAELRAHALQHVKQYTWERSAAKANAALAAAAEKARLAPGRSDAVTNRTANASLRAAFGEHVHVEALLKRQLVRVSECAAANQEYAGRTGPAGPRRQGWVTTWSSKCGIAAYSEGFFNSGLFDPVIFAPYLDHEAHNDKENVTRCWRQGKEDTLLDLERAIDGADIDELFIQFNYGFFDFDALSGVILRQVWRGRKVFILLHSTTDSEFDPRSRLELLQIALAQCCAIFVHSRRDVTRLFQLGISRNVILIPFYTPPSDAPVAFAQPRLRKIATYGFFLPGKGLMEMVEALDIARKSGATFTLKMLNAEYPTHDSSPKLITEVKSRIEELKLTDSVEICTEFLPEEESLRLLGEADLIVFPYQRTGESASSAVQMGIASGRPVAVTPLPIFDNVAGAVYQLPGCSPAKIAEGLRAWDDLVTSAGPSLQVFEDSARLWRRAHSLDEIAGFLAREMSARSATDDWALELEPKWEDVPLIKGRRQRDGVFADEMGVVCFGPYASFDAGRYRLIVSGQLRGKAPSCKVSVTAQHGGVTFGEFALADLGDGILADILLNLAEPLDNVEVVIVLGDRSELTLDRYRFYRRTR